MTRWRSVWHHPLSARVAKSAIAAGGAFWLGSLLPESLAAYNSYAALGAYTVIYPAASDSFRQAARTTAAVLLGAGLAMVVQLASWTNPLTVGLTVAIAVWLGAARWVRDQSSWIPVVALFVLAVGGASPEGFASGYVVQLVMGALFGAAVNYLLLTPVPIHELELSTLALRKELVHQLRVVAEALQDDDTEAEQALPDLPEVTPARERLRRAVDEVRRARQGNPRAHRYSKVHQALFNVGTTLQRCSVNVESMAVVMVQRNDLAFTDDVLRHRAIGLMKALADLFATPADEEPDQWQRDEVTRHIEALLDYVDSPDVRHEESRYAAGAVAMAARHCLRALEAAPNGQP